MNKNLPIVSLLCLFSIFGQHLSAQDKKHNLSVSIGAWPYTYHEEMFSGEVCYDYYRPEQGIKDVYLPRSGTYEGPMRSFGGLTLEYGHSILNWLEVGGAVTYTGFYRKLYSVKDGRKTGSTTRHYLSVVPTVRFLWLRRENVQLYSGFGVGAGFTNYRYWWDDPKCYCTGQFTLIGIRAGGPGIYFLGEIGHGAKGIFNGGVGYRF